MSTFTIEQQIACVAREISMRKRVYPRWVEQEKMTPVGAAREIACMEAVLATLERLKLPPAQGGLPL